MPYHLAKLLPVPLAAQPRPDEAAQPHHHAAPSRCRMRHSEDHNIRTHQLSSCVAGAGAPIFGPVVEAAAHTFGEASCSPGGPPSPPSSRWITKPPLGPDDSTGRASACPFTASFSLRSGRRSGGPHAQLSGTTFPKGWVTVRSTSLAMPRVMRLRTGLRRTSRELQRRRSRDCSRTTSGEHPSNDLITCLSCLAQRLRHGLAPFLSSCQCHSRAVAFFLAV
jgi:hypothetical protein